MKFGAWSYTGYYVDLKQLPQGSIFIQKIIILLSLNLLAINSVSGFFFLFYRSSNEWNRQIWTRC